MANEVVIEIKVDKDTLKASLNQAEKDSEDSGKKIGSNLGNNLEQGLGKSFGLIKTAVASLAATVGAAFTLKAVISEATQAEDAANRLAGAFRATGQNVPFALSSFQEYASSLQRTTTVSDDVITENAALLVSLGKLQGEGLERATKAALDLSAGLGISVESAFQKVAMAANGNTEVLRRYGITVGNVVSEADRFNAVLGKIDASFGGSAASKVNTFSGAVAQLTNGFGDFLEELGNLIIKSPVAVALIGEVGKQILKLTASVKDFASTGNAFDNFIKSSLEFGQTIVTYVVAPLELLYNSGVFVFRAIETGFATLVTGILGGASAISSALAFLAPETFGASAEAIKAMYQASGEAVVSLANQTNQAAQDIFQFNASAAASNFIAGFQTVADQAGPIASQMTANVTTAQEATYMNHWDYIKNGFKAAFDFSAAASEKFQQTITARMAQTFEQFKVGFAGAFASIGQALVKGQNVFDAFGKAILGVFGDLAINLGQFYFALGIASLFLNPAAGAAYIAGGLGLIVLGGALKALAGGSAGAGTGNAGGATGGGGVGGGGIATDGAATDQFAQERREPQTQVAVNIQGNVLDRRQTGLEIVEVINEAFGTQGVKFAEQA